jgi:arginine N-succinyltransferase
MFIVREVRPDDLEGLYAVAKHLDTVNLPADRDLLEHIVRRAHDSFFGAIEPLRREYVFVLEEAASGRIVGTSMIHAQHGTRRAPHVYFDVLKEERYSETLDHLASHRVLRIGYDYDGPTEIGGLILLPEHRKGPARLGKLLSFSRFLYIGAHRPLFRDEVLSELLPPLEPDGTSLLWECLGRHFTGMSYQEADRLSQSNKEFIRSLFPQGAIYVSTMPVEVQAQIGVVGPHTRGVERMLRSIGFAYAERIDPFDGGPHFSARTDEITLIKTLTRARVVKLKDLDEGRPFGLVGVERDRATDTQSRFSATGTRYVLEGGVVALPEATCVALRVEPGDEVWVQPV